MDIHSDIASIALDLIVILLLVGLWLLLMRALKLPRSVRSMTLDQARQRGYLNTAIISLMAGALWIVASATAQFIGTWGIAFLGPGIAFLSLGVLSLIKGLRWKAGETPLSPPRASEAKPDGGC